MANGRILEMLVQRNELRVSITKEFLSHVPKSGWGEKSLDDAVKFLGLKGTERLEAFPGGVPEITDFFGRWSDDRMLEALEDTYFEQLEYVGNGLRGSRRCHLSWHHQQ